VLDCKKALEATAGDADRAVEWLRTHGIAKADRRIGHDSREGLVESYLHHNGRVGVLLELNCETDFVARTPEFRALARELALHVASAAPIAVSVDQVSPELVDRERRIYSEQVAAEGKPEAVRQRIVDGKLKKFYGEKVLLEQPFVKDDKRTVGELVREAAGRFGENVVVRRFARFQLGEA
jgi:elongation factor Ts